MNILNTDLIKENIIENIIKSKRDDKIVLLSSNPREEVKYYKNAIIKRCDKFDIKVIDKEFDKKVKNKDIIDYLSTFDKNDGYIFLMPFDYEDDIDYLKENITLKDLDGFTYDSLGKVMDGEFDYLPATASAVIRFLDTMIDYEGKDIVIANRTKVIGLPLANYLTNKSATVTILNSRSRSTKEIIKKSDVFITAIGKAKFYDKSYFKDGQLLIDVGTTYKEGKVYGDIDYDDLKDLNIDILTSKRGIGAITTLSLLDKLIR